ncbi:MAG: AarF/ABC1/UbiB kinase family protein [Thermoplasmata archaeon]|nr:MAG: AarF/ABC1/UbiB kinase family protein [Thermoplasmata archaeon]
MTFMKPLGKNLKRIREIVNIAVKYGFIKTIRKLGLRNMIAMRPVTVEVSGDHAVRVRKMLEELGPSFVKIGQVLSMRPDLIPRSFVDEFSKLYDRADPFDFKEVQRIIEEELGTKMNQVFKSFDPKPIAAGSIGQVHKATLQDGSKVAVKVRRPGIEETIQSDIDIMMFFATLAEKNIAKFKTFRPREIVRELDVMLKKEMDYSLEAENGRKIYNNFSNVPSVKIPKVYEEFSTRKLLVMEFISGIRLSKNGLNVEGIDNKHIARIIAQGILKQIFDDGFFQADPSPGNIFVIDKDTVAFVDFGACGKISVRRRDQLMNILVGFASRDVDTITETLIEIADVGGDVEYNELAKDIRELVDFYHEEKPEIYDVKLSDWVIALSRKYDIRLPSDFTLLERALFETESTCRYLDPDFDLLLIAGPIISKTAISKFNPMKQMRELVVSLQKYHQMFKTLPNRVDKILKKAEKGELTLKMDVKGVSHLEYRLDKILSRLEFSLVICALILATAIIFAATENQDPTVVVFILVIIIIVWISGTIFRSIRYK